MKFSHAAKFGALLGAWLLTLGLGAHADTPPSSAAEQPRSDWQEESAPQKDDDDDDEDADASRHKHSAHRPHDGEDIVNIGSDSHLTAGAHADSVVAVFGSSTSDGDAREVVSVGGTTRVTGPLKDNAVAVFGDTYVDAAVDGDVVAVAGDVILGPHAVISGDVVAVGGTVKRDPAAITRGEVQSVGGGSVSFGWLHQWIQNCLLYGRPLALVPGIGWAWGLALVFLAIYMVMSLLFPDGVNRCVQTLESRPGMSVVAALLTVLFVPILVILLCITVIGIAAVPFVLLSLFVAGLFGKAVMLAWIGRKCMRGRVDGAFGHPAVAVLLGGAIVLALYIVPVLGFLAYKLLGLLGLGVVIYTIVVAARDWQSTRPAAINAAAAGAGTRNAAPGAPPPMPDAASATAAPSVGPAIAAALPRAGFWIRMISLLLDAVLIAVVMGILHYHFQLLVLAAYGAVMWKLRGSTIGGIIFDLQVVRLDGRRVDWETSIIRALSCFLSLAVAGLGFFWIAFDPGKLAWHDKIAGTAVVRTGARAPAA